MSELPPLNPLIPSWLDEAGLSPTQFRVACHIWRRGSTYSNAATIGKVCRLKRDTVFDALADLEKAGFIHRQSRPGQTTLIEPVPFGGTGGNGNPSRLGGHEASRLGGRDPSRLGGHKGTPTKSTPLRVSKETPKLAISIPLPFPSEAFAEAWQQWIQYRKEKKKPLTELAIKLQFKDLIAWGEEQSIASIHKTIKSGWQGLFPVDQPASRPQGQTQAAPPAANARTKQSLEIDA